LDSISIIASATYFFGINKLFRFLNRNRKKIITYHNIIRDENYDETLHLGVSTNESTFENQIDYLTEKFPISNNLDDNKTITLTFDDGYYNQYKAIKKYLIPKKLQCYLFCPLELILKQEPVITDKILFWISYSSISPYNVYIGSKELLLQNKTKKDKLNSWKKIYSTIQQSDASQKEMFNQLNAIESFDVILENTSKELVEDRLQPLNREQLNELKRHQILIGAHSINHEILSALSKQQISTILLQLKKNKEIYNTKVFCYPFGGNAEVSTTVIEEMKRQDYFEKALSNINHPIKNLNYNDFFIPRITLSNTKNRKILDFELSGTKFFLKHGKLFPKCQ
jgi:peptidoglycan/xylan/chitin deacetylase (PgdA/CDA1 family)